MLSPEAERLLAHVAARELDLTHLSALANPYFTELLNKKLITIKLTKLGMEIVNDTRATAQEHP